MNSFAMAVDARLQALDANHGLEFVEHIYVVPPDKVHEFVGGMQEGNPHWRNTHRRIVSFPRAGAGPPAAVNPDNIADIVVESRGHPQHNEGGRVAPVAGHTIGYAARNNHPWD